MTLRLLVVSGTRADLGLWRPVLHEAARREGVEVELLVTGMHLDARLGSTVDEARATGIPIAAEVPFTALDDSPAAMAASVGAALSGMAPVIVRAHPDWVCVLGDRGEQLAAAIAALHIGQAVAHLHGGERTMGAVDDAVRDMVSRIAHLHLVANDEAADRLRRMGEASWRIRVVGGPGLDDMVSIAPAGAELRRQYGLPESGPYLLVVQHPETIGQRDAVADLRATLTGVARSDIPALVVGPNADAGGRGMLEDMRRPESAAARWAFRVSIPRPDYLSLLAGATALVGNSSSGIIEAPLLGVPAVNAGDRQRGRTRGDNVIDVEIDAERIAAAIAGAADPAFRAGLSRTSPYGDGHAAVRIIDAIASQAIDARLLVKEVAA
jgi:GDP/UDP-N,N'-diacetylbacillosamine 2-epimerase (hydrolysing)